MAFRRKSGLGGLIIDSTRRKRGPSVRKSPNPYDTFYAFSTGGADYVGANTVILTGLNGPLCALDIASIYANIQAETEFTLTGAAKPLRPTLYVDWEWQLEFGNLGVTDALFEVIPYGSKTSRQNTAAQDVTNFDACWAFSYDNRPTGYEDFPQTSLLANFNAWKPGSGTADFVSLGARYFVVGCGKTKILKMKSRRTKVITFDDGTAITNMLTTGGMFGGKSLRVFIKQCGDFQQVCGVRSAASAPMLAPGHADTITNSRITYRYRWANGNVAPTVYGSNLATTETIDSVAQTFIGVPALRAVRATNQADTHNETTLFGGLDRHAKHEVLLTPVIDCASDAVVQEVQVTP